MTDKDELVEQFGGACQRCGYNECSRALHFHHVNGRSKGQSWKTDLGEVAVFPERFQLLCANCHVFTHDQLDRAKRVYHVCLHCGKEFRVKQHGPSRESRNKYCSKQCSFDARTPIVSAPDAIMKRIQKYTSIADNECHIWIGQVTGPSAKTPTIGTTTPQGKYSPRSVRQVLYELAHGSKYHGRIRATCGNELCVNPDHFLTR